MSDLTEESGARPALGRAELLKLAIAATDREDLLGTDRSAYEARLLESLGLVGARGQRPHRIAWRRDAASGLDVVDIVSADKPFIVDSVMGALHAAGARIRLFAHPVIPMGEEMGKDGPHARRESLVHVELDPLPGEEALRNLVAELDSVLEEVALAVRDWRPMLDRLHHLVATLGTGPAAGVSADARREATAFLQWLARDNFTFLGLREYRLDTRDGGSELVPVAGSGLGILARPNFRFMRSGSDYVEMTPQHAAFLAGPEPLLVTKANLRSRVHRRSHMDYVGVKRYGADGAAIGETRILGLFTSVAAAAPHEQVPIVRQKIAEVVARSGLDPAGHDGKALLSALDNYPRDELFQISTDELAEYAGLIAALAERPRVRVLPRIDRFDNFVSVLVFVPRERYSSEVRARIGEHLAHRYDGRVSAYYPSFPEGELVRVHYILGRVHGPTPRPERAALEAEIVGLTRSFADRVIAAAPDPAAVAAYAGAFPAAYRSRRTPEQAVADIAVLESLGQGGGIAVRLGRAGDTEEGGAASLGVYHYGTPIPLSDRVPMLENFGFRVIDEHTYSVHPADGAPRFIHEMTLAAPAGLALAPEDRERIEAGLVAAWEGRAENDNYNTLVVLAALSWEDVAVLRALGRYLGQLGIGYSQAYLAATLVRHPEAAAALLGVFKTLHDPAFTDDREVAAEGLRTQIAEERAATRSLDEDRILRRFANLVAASLRTNLFQRDEEGAPRPALAIKFDCEAVEGMPAPRPHREIFVYSPRVEGLHLRFGPIARGGIRWSDRPEDFRTEVLGLVKAQQVKNAIIVPAGAKGAFVPRRLPTGGGREAVLAEATASYRIFIASLIDLTDNRVEDEIVPPPDTVRRDGDDPYLVVAADKGTASFSDIANEIALSRGYWLGDAFASGGSVGYDHKEMGITARGAFEAVKRHFREMDRDVTAEPFTVVGVGDMSGDVFGNGMLLSRTIRLIAAFDHRDIFIDPDPDAERSFAERRRLFELPRSSWQDYDKSVLSKGGGIYPRTLKSVPLSPEARAALGIEGDGELTPAELIRAILTAPVDLLWFGGIGTYVRASEESNADVGDHANDAVRVTGASLRVKVVAEGANLAVTQRGRVEYALNGGRIDTDAIDNSAGVNSSDLEVNIKIALGPLVASGGLDAQSRKAYLMSLTGEVAALCLRNNYLQTLAISLAERGGVAELVEHRTLIETLEAAGILDRAVEALPSDSELDARAAAGRGLTRPEIATLLAYAKNEAEADLVRSSVPDDPWLGRELFRYFPDRLVADYPELIEGHRLRREVIATVIANAMINRGGPACIAALMAATSSGVGEIAAAYALARDAFALTDLNAEIDGLDGEVAGPAQLALYEQVRRTLRRQTLWFLRNGRLSEGLAGLVARYRAGAEALQGTLERLLPDHFARALAVRTEALTASGTPTELARRIGQLPALTLSSDIVLVAERTGATFAEAAEAFFAVLALFDLGRILDAAEAMVPADRYDRLALDRALANLMRAQRDLSVDVLNVAEGAIAERVDRWRQGRPRLIERTRRAVAELTEGELTVSRLSVAAGMLSDLAESA